LDIPPGEKYRGPFKLLQSRRIFETYRYDLGAAGNTGDHAFYFLHLTEDKQSLLLMDKYGMSRLFFDQTYMGTQKLVSHHLAGSCTFTGACPETSYFLNIQPGWHYFTTGFLLPYVGNDNEISVYTHGGWNFPGRHLFVAEGNQLNVLAKTYAGTNAPRDKGGRNITLRLNNALFKDNAGNRIGIDQVPIQTKCIASMILKIRWN
jgi:hypothetical protein